jgi:hypothetical protein
MARRDGEDDPDRSSAGRPPPGPGDVRRIDAGLLRSIALGDDAGRAVYGDWLEGRGEEEPDRPSTAADEVGGADAVPVAHDEVSHGVYLYERLSQLGGWVRHNPTGTSWVFAYRGLWRCVPVILFRPGPWLLGPGISFSDAIIKDVGDRAIATFTAMGTYGAALVEAPPGVRLRALSLALIAREERIPHAVIFDLVRRTAQEPPQGDTFIGWDGSLWFSPEFELSWDSEMPSVVGDEVYDSLVLDSPAALHGMLCGLPSALFSREPVPIHPSQRAPELEELLDEFEPWRFAQRCIERAREPAEHCARWLADQLRRLFPEAYARQRAALASVGLDIDRPWQPRRPG